MTYKKEMYVICNAAYAEKVVMRGRTAVEECEESLTKRDNTRDNNRQQRCRAAIRHSTEIQVSTEDPCLYCSGKNCKSVPRETLEDGATL